MVLEWSSIWCSQCCLLFSLLPNQQSWQWSNPPRLLGFQKKTLLSHTIETLWIDLSNQPKDHCWLYITWFTALHLSYIHFAIKLFYIFLQSFYIWLYFHYFSTRIFGQKIHWFYCHRKCHINSLLWCLFDMFIICMNLSTLLRLQYFFRAFNINDSQLR